MPNNRAIDINRLDADVVHVQLMNIVDVDYVILDLFCMNRSETCCRSPSHNINCLAISLLDNGCRIITASPRP